MTQTVPATCVLGPGKTNLTIGLRVLNLDGTTYAAFSTTDVAETSTAGTYRKAGGVVCPDAGAYIVWGTALVDYAEATVGPASSTPAALAVVNANVDAVLADTTEMQDDLANGGRIDKLIDGIKAKTDLITTGLVTVTSPVTSDGDVTVYQGDDYHNGDGCALAWSSSSWPDLTGASVALLVKAPSGELLTAVGSAVDPGTATQTARVELTAAETATLVAWPGPSTLRVRATLSNGRVRTLVDSTLAAIEALA